MKINTLYSDLKCPHCENPIESGIGFCVGALTSTKYRIGEKLSWEGEECRPAGRPAGGNLKTIGYFNCDNPGCSSWLDCYPQVQSALIVIQNDQIREVSVYNGVLSGEKFEILNASVKDGQ